MDVVILFFSKCEITCKYEYKGFTCLKKNNDDNIHISEALKSDGRTEETITLLEC